METTTTFTLPHSMGTHLKHYILTSRRSKIVGVVNGGRIEEKKQTNEKAVIRQQQYSLGAVQDVLSNIPHQSVGK